MKREVDADVIGTVYVGCFEGDTEEEIEEQAYQSGRTKPDLCHHCEGSIFDMEVLELHLSEKESTPIGARDEKSRSWMGIFPIPFAYDRDGGYIVDAEGHPVLEIRGYGKISQLTDAAKANTVQDEFAQWVVRTLNGTTAGE